MIKTWKKQGLTLRKEIIFAIQNILISSINFGIIIAFSKLLSIVDRKIWATCITTSNTSLGKFNKIWDNTCFNTLADTNKTDGNKKGTNQCSLNMWKKSITVLELTEGSMNLF